MFGVDDLKVFTKRSILSKAIQDGPKISRNDGKHFVNKEDLFDLPAQLHDPVAVLKSAS